MDFMELLQLLRSCETAEQIDEKRDEIAEFLPEIKPMFGFDQKMKCQCDELWTHSLNTVTKLPKDLPDDMANNLLYFAALIHDIAKPQTQAVDPQNPEYMVYKGHCEKAVQMLDESIIPRINANGQVLSNSDIACLKYYVQYHHDQAGRIKKYVRKHLKLGTYGQFLNLMHLQIADCKAQFKCKETIERVEFCDYILKKSEGDFVSLFMFSKWLF